MRASSIGGMGVSVLLTAAATGQPYDLSPADGLLQAALPQLNGHVAVIVRQNGTELYRFQAGDIDYGTKTRLASLTKTVSAAVVLTLVDDGALVLNERLGDSFPLFESRGLGDPTVLDAWAMRHGIDSLIAYEHDARYTLGESVALLGLTGYLTFAPPGAQLAYDGAGMQAVGRIVELRAGGSWEAAARLRIFDRCAMPQADYAQFAPNPSVPGGLRSSAEEIVNFAQMVLDRGMFGGARVLSEAAIGQFFTNRTRGLPVQASPWPATHPQYPYSVDPDYSFGAWVLAENPATQHVEEIVGAGAWGSFVWIDRRRGLTAVLITDVPAGSQAALDPALGLFAIAREQVDTNQVRELAAARIGGGAQLAWTPASAASATRVYGAASPIRDVFDLAEATLLTTTSGTSAMVPGFDYYAVTAVYSSFENRSLVPGGNARAVRTPRPDLTLDGLVDAADYAVLAAALGDSGPASPGDVDGDGDADLADFAVMQAWFGASAP